MAWWHVGHLLTRIEQMNTLDTHAVIVLVAAVLVGCGGDGATPDASNNVTQPTDETKQYDTKFMLDRLRENVSSSEWSIAPSPLSWSTFTADVGDEFAPDTASYVWQKWTAVPTALTLKANAEIKNEIEAAVKVAKPAERPVEREFDFNGFRFVVTASNGESADTTFVRISFMDSRYAN